MGITRRRFVRLVVGIGTAATASIVWVVARTVPLRYVEAIRTRFYPGPRKSLDEAGLSEPGYWEG